jgi:hypothetical protein
MSTDIRTPQRNLSQCIVSSLTNGIISVTIFPLPWYQPYGPSSGSIYYVDENGDSPWVIQCDPTESFV